MGKFEESYANTTRSHRKERACHFPTQSTQRWTQEENIGQFIRRAVSTSRGNWKRDRT